MATVAAKITAAAVRVSAVCTEEGERRRAAAAARDKLIGGGGAVFCQSPALREGRN